MVPVPAIRLQPSQEASRGRRSVGNRRRGDTERAPGSWILRIMFEGFASKFVDTGDASIFTRHGGEEPAMLLLHGHPARLRRHR